MEAAMEPRKIGDAAARGSWCVQQATAAKLQVAGNTKHRPYAAHRQPLVQTIDFPFPRPFFFNKVGMCHVLARRAQQTSFPYGYIQPQGETLLQVDHRSDNCDCQSTHGFVLHPAAPALEGRHGRGDEPLPIQPQNCCKVASSPRFPALTLHAAITAIDDVARTSYTP